MSDSVHFDMEEALARLDGDQELLNSILEMFLSDLPRMIDEIRQPLQTQDAKQVQAASHSLKGAALNCSVPILAHLALELETEGRNENLTNASETFTKLEAEFETLKTILLQQVST